MKNNITLNDLNFYYSFLKTEVETFLKGKDLLDKDYNDILNKLIVNTLKIKMLNKDFKNEIISLREKEEF